MPRPFTGYLCTLFLLGAGVSTSCGSDQKFTGIAFAPTGALKSPAAEDSTARPSASAQEPLAGPGMQHQGPDGEAAGPLAEAPDAEVPAPTPAHSETQEPTAPSPAEPVKVVDALALCGTAAMKTRKVKVLFPASVQGCSWSQKDNLAAKDGKVRARIEQVADLGVELNQTFCGVSLSSPVQDIQFDDEMILTLNGRVLMSSFDYNDRFETVDGQAVYSWNKLADAFNPGPATPPKPYCLGAAAVDGNPNCTLPKTETSGKFELTIPMADAHKLSSLAKKHGKAELGLIVTGDNNAADCSHSDLTLDVAITYVGKN